MLCGCRKRYARSLSILSSLLPFAVNNASSEFRMSPPLLSFSLLQVLSCRILYLILAVSVLLRERILDFVLFAERSVIVSGITLITTVNFHFAINQLVVCQLVLWTDPDAAEDLIMDISI